MNFLAVPIPQFDIVLAYFIHRRMGEVAVELWFHHPDRVYAQTFIATTAKVDGYGIDKVQTSTKRTLVQMVNDGDLTTPAKLGSMGVAVTRMNAFHHSFLSKRRNNPTILIPSAGGPGEEITLPLFTSAVDAAAHAVTTLDPAAGLIRAEQFARVRCAARRAGCLRFRIAVYYGRYEFEFGKNHGAYQHIARLAVLDGAGRVVKIRPWRTEVDNDVKPDPKVVRQIRLLQEQAWDAFGEGEGLPVGV